MIDEEEEGDQELDEEVEEDDMEVEKEEKTGGVKCEHGNSKKRRIELYQLEEIIADSEENVRRIIGTGCPWHC